MGLPRIFFGALCGLFLGIGSASGKEALFRVQVLSKTAATQARVEAAGLEVFRGDAFERYPAASGLTVLALEAGVELDGQRFSELRLRSSAGPVKVTVAGAPRSFTGELNVRSEAGTLEFVELLPVESYVRGVLASELPEDFPLEAQKAQAVLIRSYALAHRGRHAGEGFDFCDLTHCQTYAGLAAESGIRDEALRATRSLVLSHGGKPIEGLYHSTCGGPTSANQRVFGGRPLPYLQGVDDQDYCAASPHSSWSSRIPLEKISAALAEDHRLRASIPLHGMVAGDREPGGRVFSLRLAGPRSGEIATMEFLSRIGKALGWNLVKSNWFDVAVEEGVAAFHGRGLGHGVGLCQWGARGMALSGSRFDEILRHYFPGARLRSLP
ncbi:MAG: SpoIID/LytB domain-containing protein [Deltaproteobacteria bacterium]|nr:SpoIID/LytB domain-containing protein [Deltaproteobacteria bacterium]